MEENNVCKNHMLPKDKLTTVELKENISSALNKINKGDFLSLPVLDGDEFKGIIMKEAIYRAYLTVITRIKRTFYPTPR